MAILVHLFLFIVPLRFFTLQNVQTSSAVHPASFLVDTRVRVKWQGCEVDHWCMVHVELDLCLHGIDRENFTVVVLALKTYLCIGFMLLQF